MKDVALVLPPGMFGDPGLRRWLSNFALANAQAGVTSQRNAEGLGIARPLPGLTVMTYGSVTTGNRFSGMLVTSTPDFHAHPDHVEWLRHANTKLMPDERIVYGDIWRPGR